MESVALVGRLLLSLAVVLGLMWLIAKRVKRGGRRGKNGKLIELLSRQQLSRSASLAVVRVLDQALIVGITDGQVTVLGQADLDGAQQALEALDAGKAAHLTPTAQTVQTVPTVQAGQTVPTVQAGQTVPTVQADQLAQAVQAALDAQSPSRTQSARPVYPTRPGRPARAGGPTRPANRAAATSTPSRGALSGSALSLNTWRQTLDSLRDLTARRT